MQGDPKVDELMRPVLAAIKRHVKDREAAAEIYNRAYEAVMNSMDVKSGKTYCAYCGAEYPLDDAAATSVSEHIKTCEKHPMRAVEARAEAAEARAEKLQTALQAANEDAERLASESAFYEEGTGWRCIHCGENTKRNGYAVKHAADCPITLHRARVGGLEK